MKLPIDPSPAVLAVEPYSSHRHPAPMDLRLDGNEGPPPPDPTPVLTAAGPEVWRRYPSAAAFEAHLAERLGVAPEAVLVTAGADDALERAVRAVACPGREVVLTDPTFEMLPRYVRLAGADVVAVPWWRGRFPVGKVLRVLGPRTAAVAVVSPNNPTGAAISAADLEALARGCGRALLLLDHAYVEFADEDLTPVALRFPNAVVLRTLSKAWGLAGLRVGYAVGRPELIALLRRVGQPYPVSGPSLAAAEALVDRGDVTRHVAEVRRRRAGLTAVLAGRGAEVLPSQGNFVLARFAGAAWVREGLAGLGIAVRAFPGRPGFDGWLRITVPPDDDALARLERALDVVLAPEALLLDMDGVLADVSRSYREAIRATSAAYGVVVTPEEITAAKAEGDANDDWELTRRLLAGHGVEVPLEEVIERFEALYQGGPGRPGLKEREVLVPSPETLPALARRLPLAIVTGRPRADAEAFLERFGLADTVSALVSMEDGPGKPAPDPVRLALDRLGVRRAWLVGDTPDDVRAARAAGVVPLGVVPPGEDGVRWSDVLLRSGAARVLSSLDHLMEVLP